MSNTLIKLIDGISPAKVRAALKKKGRAYHNVKPLLYQIADKTSNDNHTAGRGAWWNQAHLAFFTGFTKRYVQEAEYAAAALGMLKVSSAFMNSNHYVLVEDAIKPFTVEIRSFNQPLENPETSDSSNTPNVDGTPNVLGATHDVSDAAHTVYTEGTQGVDKPKGESKRLNPNGTAKGWIDRQMNIANTESLATLGSTSCDVPLATTSQDSESTKKGNQVPVSGKEKGSPAGEQPTPCSAAPLPKHDPMTCQLKLTACKLCTEWSAIGKNQKDHDTLNYLTNLMKRIGGFDKNRCGRAALWIFKNHDHEDYTYVEVMEWLVAASNAPDNPLYKPKKLNTGIGLVKNWDWVVARYRSYIDSADENARTQAKGDGYSNVIAWVAKRLRGAAA
ncbi:MAG: hypothetical protein ABSH13_23515 [Candidatus Acidiferrum sp.]|jgi:hypothetical protein